MKIAIERPPDALDAVMKKHNFWKVIRVTSWVSRFIHNCRALKKMKLTGPLTTEETTNLINFWIRRVQMDVEETYTFMVDNARLNFQKNKQQIYISLCLGRFQ